MATVSERSKELADTINDKCIAWGYGDTEFRYEKAAQVIEQALLAERRLAMEEAAKIADDTAAREENIRNLDWSAQLLGVGAAKAIAAELRAAAVSEDLCEPKSSS